MIDLLTFYLLVFEPKSSLDSYQDSWILNISYILNTYSCLEITL